MSWRWRCDFGRITTRDTCARWKASRDANQTRRLLALAAIYEGGSRGEAARIGGVGIQPFDKLRSAGLGAGVQRGRPGGADRRQGAR